MTKALLLLLAIVCAAGCRTKFGTADEAIVALQDEDFKQRVRAADYLRKTGAVPKEAIQPLLEAIENEENPNAYGAMLITLGASGAPEARPLICEKMRTGDNQMRRWATGAAFQWAQRNGLAKIAVGSGGAAMAIDQAEFCPQPGAAESEPTDGDAKDPASEGD